MTYWAWQLLSACGWLCRWVGIIAGISVNAPELLAQPERQPLGPRLNSWKEIAGYLSRSERTVHRWEEKEGLPVHRLQHEKRGSVYAYRWELDGWRDSRPVARPVEVAGKSRRLWWA